ncbi:peptidylprolyl isomerase [Maricaulis salignorans]|uniref:peptidylprolyl isomerase n=1 Tax=Maricaulis salignorans TaxID=144026 RepID=A0A1G9PSI9_9PROT|nr:peptidylprolyl isomerase [Maricaulis salignorans]SDM01754.1 peptidylprolyl isomerase [Maricaulis salignorans]
MIKHLSLSLVLAMGLTAAACAREAETPQTSDPAITTLVQDETLGGGAVAYDFPEDAWRDLDPENTLYIETPHGRVVVELAPEFAPTHVERMKTLARAQFYDFLVWHRVLDGFMAQGGGSRANPNHRSELPSMNSEFTVRRGAELPVSELQDRMINRDANPRSARAGFWNGFPAGTQTLAAAALTGDGMINSWLLHCTGAAAMARTNDPNSAGSQFYITRGNAEHLNTIYTVWGRVRAGQEAVDALRLGTLGQDPGFVPDTIDSMRVAADLPEAERTHVQVIDTESAAFTAYLDSLRNAAGALPDVCEIPVPTRILE